MTKGRRPIEATVAASPAPARAAALFVMPAAFQRLDPATAPPSRIGRRGCGRTRARPCWKDADLQRHGAAGADVALLPGHALRKKPRICAEEQAARPSRASKRRGASSCSSSLITRPSTRSAGRAVRGGRRRGCCAGADAEHDDAEEIAEIVPAAIVRHRVDRDLGHEERQHPGDREDEAVPQAEQEARRAGATASAPGARRRRARAGRRERGGRGSRRSPAAAPEAAAEAGGDEERAADQAERADLAQLCRSRARASARRHEDERRPPAKTMPTPNADRADDVHRLILPVARRSLPRRASVPRVAVTHHWHARHSS